MRRLSWSERVARALMSRESAFAEQWKSGNCHIALQGVEYVWRTTKQADYFNYLRHKVDSLIDGDSSECRIGSARALLFLYRRTGEERYRHAAARARAKLLPALAQPDRNGHEPAFAAESRTDATCKLAPFLAQYAVLFDEPELLETVVRSLLLSHGYDDERKEPGESTKPLSGTFLMAVVDLLDFLPVHHPKRQRLLAVLQNQLRLLIRTQLPMTGLWQGPPGASGSRSEEATIAKLSCLFVYALFKAARNGHIPRTFGHYARRAYEGILTEWAAEDRNGQTRCPDGHPDAATAEDEGAIGADVPDLNGIGAFLLASVEADFVSELTGPVR
ncbi:MAG: glycoside hydrolase family 88 protein [Paenibacillaceae bacterium]|nr:glycoside hydrolase family 88 protein [Paenibacillaceae bacterium]